MISLTIWAWVDREIGVDFVAYGIKLNDVPLWPIPENAKSVFAKSLKPDDVWKTIKKAIWP